MIYIWLILILWFSLLAFRLYLDYKFIVAPFHEQNSVDKIKKILANFDYIIFGVVIITGLLICLYFLF